MIDFLRGRLTYSALAALLLNMAFGREVFVEEDIVRAIDAGLVLVAFIGRLRASVREALLRRRLAE